MRKVSLTTAIISTLQLTVISGSACALGGASFVSNHKSIKSNRRLSFHRGASITSNTFTKPLLIRGGDTSTSLYSSNDLIVTTLVPKIGVLTSTLLYLSPFSAVQLAQKNKDAGSLNPIPLSIMAISSLCWLVYGLSIRDAYVTLSNVPGCVISLWYVVTILPLLWNDSYNLKQTQTLLVSLSGLTIGIWTWLSLTRKTMGQISSILGMYASLLFILLSGSPLSTIRNVVSTKSSKSILMKLTVAQVVNTTLWSAYGTAIRDRFVWGPNLVGLMFGLVQLLLKIVYRD